MASMEMPIPQLALHLRGNNDTITGIAFHDTEQKFAVSSLDKTVALYSTERKNKRVMKFRYGFEVYDCDYSSQNMFAVVGNTRKIAISEAIYHNGHQSTIVGHHSKIRSVHFSNSGNRIITGSDDKSVKMFRLGHRNFISSYVGHTNWIRCARFSPTNDLIASCGEDKTLKIFDTVNGTLVHSFKDEKGYGNQICWNKDNRSLAIAQENGRVKIYDIPQRKLVQYYRVFDCGVKCVDFHPSGKYLITGDDKGLVKILDLLEGREVFTIRGHHGPVTAVKFSKDGKYFVTGSKDKHIMVFKSHLTKNETCNPASFEMTDTPTDSKENFPFEENIIEKVESESVPEKSCGSTVIDSRKSIHYNFMPQECI